MNKTTVAAALVSLVLGFWLGGLRARTSQPPASVPVAEPTPEVLEDSGETEPLAYMLVASRTVSDGSLEAYGNAARPAAVQAGIAPLARSTEVEVFEGEWPYEGTLIVETFSSMAALREFWYSDRYQAAKKLRDGIVELDFAVAIEGSE